jgi:hypothetical protein
VKGDIAILFSSMALRLPEPSRVALNTLKPRREAVSCVDVRVMCFGSTFAHAVKRSICVVATGE